MYYNNKYTFTRTIISGGRVTVPKVVLKELNVKEGGELKVTFELNEKEIKGIVL